MMPRSSNPASDGLWVILGGGGMLGRAWSESLRADPPPGGWRALTRAQCDITSEADAAAAIAPGVGVVVNAAAWTDVDGAEADEAGALRVNADGPAILAERCQTVGALLVHYSTDYVFDGAAATPYRVDHPRAPINAYGRSKAAGEERIESSGCDHLIVRTSWLYAAHGGNFVNTIARACRAKPSLRVVADQIGRPTSCDSLVAATRRLIAAGARGAQHACDAGECSWFDLARAIARRVNPACRVEPCATDEFPRPAPRPAYSVLDLSATEALIGPLTPWPDALARTLDRMTQEDAAEAAAPGRRSA